MSEKKFTPEVEIQEKLAKLPNSMLQRKSRSATGEYWYDLEPRRQKNARFMRRFELRLKP